MCLFCLFLCVLYSTSLTMSVTRNNVFRCRRKLRKMTEKRQIKCIPVPSFSLLLTPTHKMCVNVWTNCLCVCVCREYPFVPTLFCRCCCSHPVNGDQHTFCETPNWSWQTYTTNTTQKKHKSILLLSLFLSLPHQHTNNRLQPTICNYINLISHDKPYSPCHYDYYYHVCVCVCMSVEDDF